MRKIPTLFVRDPENRRYVLPKVTPDCEWVLADEGVATRKYDGTCVGLDAVGRWWARREVKPGKEAPPGFLPISTDEVTGKVIGWVPAESSSFHNYLLEAIGGLDFAPGTYELIGPRINGNPEQMDAHVLVAHGGYMFTEDEPPRTYDGLRMLFTDPDSDWPARFEGIVWHHDDGRMAKIKRRDFAPSPDKGE